MKNFYRVEKTSIPFMDDMFGDEYETVEVEDVYVLVRLTDTQVEDLSNNEIFVHRC